MPRVGFEPAITVFELSNPLRVIDRADYDRILGIK
jgi:hypothetical protein